jgi:hypothetical protein
VGKVNWTIVAISAGVTLGAGVAVLGNDTPASTGGGLIIPPTLEGLGQQAPQVPAGPIIASYPDDPVPPRPVVVPVAPAGYVQSLTPPPVAAPPKQALVSVPPAVARPVRAITSAVKPVTSPALTIARQSISSIPTVSSFDWFTSSTSTDGRYRSDGGYDRYDSGDRYDGGYRSGGDRDGGGRHRR